MSTAQQDEISLADVSNVKGTVMPCMETGVIAPDATVHAPGTIVAVNFNNGKGDYRTKQVVGIIADGSVIPSKGLHEDCYNIRFRYPTDLPVILPIKEKDFVALGKLDGTKNDIDVLDLYAIVLDQARQLDERNRQVGLLRGQLRAQRFEPCC